MSPEALPIFANEAAQVLVDPAGFLRITWHSQLRPLAATQAVFEQMLRQLRAHGWSRIFINQTGMPAFSPAEQHWIATDWLPRAVREGGYRHGALLVSPAVLVRLATAFITTNVQGLSLIYRSFDDEAEAVRWLVRQPARP